MREGRREGIVERLGEIERRVEKGSREGIEKEVKR